MATQKMGTSSERVRILIEGEELSHAEVLKQLDRIAGSTYFRNSKRYPSFLRFVVEHTLAGNTEVLKERTLGTEVFARPNEYDTNADPIVRVTAGEIRKRIAQYYQTPGHEHELRIDLPLGSYVPQFLPAHLDAPIAEHDPIDHPNGSQVLPYPALQLHAVVGVPFSNGTPNRVPPPPVPAVPTSPRRRRAVMIFSAVAIPLLLAASLLTVSFVRNRAKSAAMRYFWNPTLSSSSPVLIVIGVHSLDNKGDSLPTDAPENARSNSQENVLSTLQYYDMVPVSDVVSYNKLTNLITRNSHPYQTKGSAHTNLEDLLHGPVVLVGGLDNIWTVRLTSALRYRFYSSGTSKYEIRDSAHPATVWMVDYLQPVLNNSRDYAIVASYFDPTIEQRVLIAAGIGMNGTVAATEFLTNQKYIASWAQQAKLQRYKNVELVLSTEILDGQPGPPHVLASYAW